MRNLLFLMLFFLTSCASPKEWRNTYSVSGNFSQDRYECIQSAQQRVENTTVNRQWGLGISTNQVITNEFVFSACMNSKGWYLLDKK